MTTKTEERFKLIIKEYIEEKQSEVSANATSILLYGFFLGVLSSFSGIASIIIGSILGYAVAKKNITSVDHYLLRSVSILNYSKDKLLPKDMYFTDKIEPSKITEIIKEKI